MSETPSPTGALPNDRATGEAEASTRGMFLSDLIRERVREFTTRAAPGWLAENAIDPATGNKVLSTSGAAELMTQPRKGWLNLPTIRGLAACLQWPPDRIYIANAVSIGLPAPDTDGLSEFASMVPPWMDQLPTSVQIHVREGIMLFGRAHGLTD